MGSSWKFVPGILVPAITARSRQSAEEEEAVSQQTIGYDGALNNGAHEPRALLEPQALEAAPDGVDEAETRGLVCERRVDCVVVHVVCYVHEDLVRLGTDCRLAVAHFADEDGLDGKPGGESEALRVGCTAEASRKLKRP
jgi:hypothetical protein